MRQPCKFVPSPRLEPLRGIRICTETLRPSGEAGDRRERGARDQCSQQGCQRDSDQADHHEGDAQPPKHPVDLGQRTGHLHRPAVGIGGGQNAKVDATDGCIGEETPMPRARDLKNALIDRQCACLVRWTEDQAVWPDELHVSRSSPERSGRSTGKPLGRRLALAAQRRNALDRLEGPSDGCERSVHLSSQIGAVCHIHRDCDSYNHPGDGKRGDSAHPTSKAHGSDPRNT